MPTVSAINTSSNVERSLPVRALLRSESLPNLHTHGDTLHLQSEDVTLQSLRDRHASMIDRSTVLSPRSERLLLTNTVEDLKLARENATIKLAAIGSAHEDARSSFQGYGRRALKNLLFIIVSHVLIGSRGRSGTIVEHLGNPANLILLSSAHDGLKRSVSLHRLSARREATARQIDAYQTFESELREDLDKVVQCSRASAPDLTVHAQETVQTGVGDFVLA